MSVPTKDKASGDGVPDKRVWGVKAELRFRRLLAEVMTRSGKNRANIAREMSQALGLPADRTIPKNMLDDCVRSRKKGRMVRFPAAWIPALCQATGSDQLQRHLLSDRLLKLVAIGESVAQAAAALERAREVVEQITKPDAQCKPQQRSKR